PDCGQVSRPLPFEVHRFCARVARGHPATALPQERDELLPLHSAPRFRKTINSQRSPHLFAALQRARISDGSYLQNSVGVHGCASPISSSKLRAPNPLGREELVL